MLKFSKYHFNFAKNKKKINANGNATTVKKKMILGVRWGTTLHTAVSVSRTSGAPIPCPSLTQINNERGLTLNVAVQKSNVAVDVCQVSSIFGPQPAGFPQRKKKRGGSGVHINARNVKRLNLDWIDSVILGRKQKNCRWAAEETVCKAAQFHSAAGLMVIFGQKQVKNLKSGHGMYDCNESMTVLTFTRANSRSLK